MAPKYRRILEIDPSHVQRMTVSARLFGLDIRPAQSDCVGDYVIEGHASDKPAIDRIVELYKAATVTA